MKTEILDLRRLAKAEQDMGVSNLPWKTRGGQRTDFRILLKEAVILSEVVGVQEYFLENKAPEWGCEGMV